MALKQRRLLQRLFLPQNDSLHINSVILQEVFVCDRVDGKSPDWVRNIFSNGQLTVPTAD
jgi:hypothetical protein